MTLRFNLSKLFLATLGVALFALLGSAAAASAATFEGETSRDRPVRLTTDTVSQVPTKFVIAWRTGKCQGRGNSFSSTTRFNGFETATTDKLRTKGSYVIKQPRDNLRSKVRVKLFGERVSETRWNGTFSATANVKRRGKPFDRCRQPQLRWTATLAAPGKSAAEPALSAPQGLRR